MKALRLLFLAATVAMTGALATATSAAGAETSIVMSGLENPRGLAFGPDGGLYVAEAGRGPGGRQRQRDPRGGGGAPCYFLRGDTVCGGATGAVSRLLAGQQERLVSGLPSSAGPNQAEGGPQDVAFGPDGMYVTIGLGADPAVRSIVGPGYGRLVRITGTGAVQSVADVAAFEAASNPDGGPLDSNAFSVVLGASGPVVTDAGGNTLLAVSPAGTLSTLAVFPSRSTGRSTDSVPTSVAIGRDGAYYVSELTGVPFPVGGARIYRVVPGQAPQVYLEGFTEVIDLAFAPDGSLYVLQHATAPFFNGPGALIRVAPDGTRTTILTQGLLRPTGLAIGPDGTLYVSNQGIAFGAGQVLRIKP